MPTSHCPEAHWQDNPGAAATPSRAAVIRGNRAAISDADGHTGGGKGIPRAFMRILRSRDCPVRSLGIPFGNKGPIRTREGPTARIRLPPAASHFANLVPRPKRITRGPRVRIRRPPATSQRRTVPPQSRREMRAGALAACPPFSWRLAVMTLES